MKTRVFGVYLLEPIQGDMAAAEEAPWANTWLCVLARGSRTAAAIILSPNTLRTSGRGQ